MRRVSSPLVCLLSCIVIGGAACGVQTGFEAQSQQARNRNPPGVGVILRTASVKTAFHLFETIPIELVFQASTPDTYSIELDEAMNVPGGANLFAVSPTNSVFLPNPPFELVGFVCCASDRRYLSPQAIILERELTDYMRFEKPGTYSLYYTTRRVFRGTGKPVYVHMSPLTLTSNVLTITILPDDPAWDAARLAETLRKLRDPKIKADYARVASETPRSDAERDFYVQNRVNQTELVKAQEALNALDTEDAIRDRIKLMYRNTKEDLEAMKYGALASEAQPLLLSTTRPDLVAGCMEERADEPQFAVDYDFVVTWSKFLLQQEHPELFRPKAVVSFSQPSRAPLKFREEQAGVWRVILHDLQAAVAQKKGTAAKLTAFTIKQMKSLPGIQPGIGR